MQLLLCAATPFEIAPATDWIGREHPGKISVLITGVGLTATAYSLTRALCTSRPDLVIQAGIGGTFDQHQRLGDTVIVGRELIGDLGVEEQRQFRSLFDLNLLSPDTAPWKDGWLSNERDLNSYGLPIVDGVTVNEISTAPHRIEAHTQRSITVESMEGAALHYVCLMEKIPFLQLRALSNFAGERDKSKWKMKLAIEQLNIELQRILSEELKK